MATADSSHSRGRGASPEVSIETSDIPSRSCAESEIAMEDSIERLDVLSGACVKSGIPIADSTETLDILSRSRTESRITMEVSVEKSDIPSRSSKASGISSSRQGGGHSLSHPHESCGTSAQSFTPSGSPSLRQISDLSESLGTPPQSVATSGWYQPTRQRYIQSPQCSFDTVGQVAGAVPSKAFLFYLYSFDDYMVVQ